MTALQRATRVSLHKDLTQSAQEGQEKVQHAKARLARYMEEKDDELLQHNRNPAGRTSRTPPPRRPSCLAPSRWRR